MANARWIKCTMVIYTEIVRKMINPSFKFSQGGATFKTINNFLDMFCEEFLEITEDRLVDFCICTAYAYRGRDNWTVKQVFGRASIQRLIESKKGARYYEDQWLAEKGLTRNKLIELIMDRSEHPLGRYIFVPAEEATKLRYLNKEVGYALCQSSTLGWSPISEACLSCISSDSCKKATAGKYPELYRIRVEYGKSIQ